MSVTEILDAALFINTIVLVGIAAQEWNERRLKRRKDAKQPAKEQPHG